jgi:hypothetical protein
VRPLPTDHEVGENEETMKDFFEIMANACWAATLMFISITIVLGFVLGFLSGDGKECRAWPRSRGELMIPTYKIGCELAGFLSEPLR